MYENAENRPLATLIAVLGALMVVLLARPVTAEPPAGSAAPASAAARALEQFKNLAGAWRGTNDHGQTVRMTYELVGDGSAVLERFQMEGEGDHDMATLYHLDGDSLMLTHYCSAGNQPRMRARPAAGKDGFVFELVDVTNLESEGAGHMRRARFEFPADGKMTTSWTWHEGGQDAFTVVVEAERVPEQMASN